MRIPLIITLLLLSVYSQAQTSSLFEKMPQFLSSASPEELARTFKHPDFFRFSSTWENRIEVAYENSPVAQTGSFERILHQLEKFRSQLALASKEKPVVEYFNWAEYRERTEVYPCGLVAVFRDNQLGSVWIDLK